MLKKVTLAAFVMSLAVVLTACGKSESGSGSSGSGSGAPSGPDLSTPQGALKALQEAFASMDPAKFQACYTAESWKVGEAKIRKEIEEMKKEGVTISISWTDADIKVEGDKAEVMTKMKIKTKEGEEEEGERFRMAKVDGKWGFVEK